MDIDLVCYLNYRDATPFRVTLLPDALDHLIADAVQAFRVYELMMIRRPGDVWKYVWVKLVEVPTCVTDNMRYKKENRYPWGGCPWTDDMILLPDFDSLFYWAWDDTEPESQTWLTARGQPMFKELAARLFEKVTAAQDALAHSSDPLIRAELQSIADHSHSYEWENQAPLKPTRPDYVSPIAPKRTAAYYEKLASLLARPDIRMVSSRGDEDYPTVRAVCEEQRRRSEDLGKPLDEALPLLILTDGMDSLTQWNASCICWQEGLGYGDLMLDGQLNHSLHFFIRAPYKATRLALTHRPELLEIPGYTRTQGDGWVLYEDENPGNKYTERIEQSWKSYQERMQRTPPT